MEVLGSRHYRASVMGPPLSFHKVKLTEDGLGPWPRVLLIHIHVMKVECAS